MKDAKSLGPQDQHSDLLELATVEMNDAFFPYTRTRKNTALFYAIGSPELLYFAVEVL